MMNYTQILLWTTHCGLLLNVTSSNSFLYTSERLLAVKEFTWIRVSNSKLLLSPWAQGLLVSGDCPCILRNIMSASCLPCILTIIQLDYYCFCLLLTAYSKLKDFWRSDLPPHNEDFSNGPLLWVSWWTARTRDVSTALGLHSNVYGWLRTARNWLLEIFVPHKTNLQHNVRLQWVTEDSILK